MSIPTLEEPLSLLSGTDWREDFEFFLTDETEPDDLTGATIYGALRIRLRTGEKVVKFSSSSGEITLSGTNRVQVVLEEEVTSALTPGLYEFQLRVKRSGDVDEPLLVGTIEVVEGFA